MTQIDNSQTYIFDLAFAYKIMKSRLKITNFGPITDVDLALKNVNVFIGQQASGKSCIAKIFTIFKSPRKFFKVSPDAIDVHHKYSKDLFNDVLKEFNIESFLKPNTEIIYESEVHKMSYINGELDYDSKLLNKVRNLNNLLESDFTNNKSIVTNKIFELFPIFLLFKIEATNYILGTKSGSWATPSDIESLDYEKFKGIIDIIKNIELELSINAAIYIPAERNIANIVKRYAANLILNEVPIPKHILLFAAELEKLPAKTIKLSFINDKLNYKVVDGFDRIYINENEFISLESAASGIQSVIPILSFADKMSGSIHKSFVIEEPELNLFPTAQYRLIELVESIRHDPKMWGWEDIGIIHTYTTHSPYILSALNNFLYAYKVIDTISEKVAYNHPSRKVIEKNITEKVKDIVKAAIDPKSFTAYQIKDGFANLVFILVSIIYS